MKVFSGFILILILASSCKTSKHVPYLQGNFDSTGYANFVLPEPIIQKGDLLNITIFSDNPEATVIYNQAGGSVENTGGSSSSSGAGYLVDQDGNIRLHAIGLVLAEGLTKKQLTAVIVKKLVDLQSLSNPYCVIRFENFKVTVIGEVKSQGVFTIPGEKASVLEAIGLAGGLTDYGRKENVLLIRENQGKRKYSFLDLSKADLVISPDFYLQQNDVLVVDVDPTKQTPIDQEKLRNFGLILSIISTVALLANLALRFEVNSSYL